MGRLIYTYALIKSLYDRGKDYIDSFWPFAVKVLPRGKFVDLSSIQRNLREKFDLEIPLHVLRTILNRAKRTDYIEQKNERYKLTERGFEYSDTLETDKEVERRINALLEDMEQFFDERNISLSPEQIRDILLSFIRKDIEHLVEFINPSATLSELAVPKPEGNENLLIGWIKAAEQRKPEHYKTFQDMLLGSIISVVLYAEEPSEMTEISTRRFKHCQVFLDTNFVFFILDLHVPEFNEPAKELFNLLKKYGFDLKVFDFTVNEICRVISGYPRESFRYPTTISVATLYSSLKKKGWTNTDAKDFITNIEDILDKEGIKIEWGTDVDLKTYNPTNEELRNLMGRYKSSQNLFAQNHDLAAIEKIKGLRGKPARKIEDARVFLLTSDGRLSRFNFIEMGHKENGTVCEVILDRLLTSILWLKDPSTRPPLKSIIAVHSRDLFIKRKVWDRFYEVLQQLRQEEKVKDENISMLFYHAYIEDALKEFDETKVDEITPEFVLEKIEQVAKFKEKEMERTIREKEAEFFRKLREVVSEKEQEKEREWLEEIQKIKGNLRKSAERQANRDSTIYASVLTLLVLGVMYGIYLVFKKVGAFELLTLFIPIMLGGGGMLGLWTKLRAWLKRKLADRIYAQKLREAKLDEKKD